MIICTSNLDGTLFLECEAKEIKTLAIFGGVVAKHCLGRNSRGQL